MAVYKRVDGAWPPGEALLARGFVVSIIIHVLLVSFFFTGQKLGWWRPGVVPSWVKSYKEKLELIKGLKQGDKRQPEAMVEPPMMFVEVAPDAATPEPPKAPKYYSKQNAFAANRDATIETETPKLDGTQTHVPKTETSPRATPPVPAPTPKPAPTPPKEKPSEPTPLQPPTEPSKVVQVADAKPKGGELAGNFTRAKPEVRKGDGVAEKGNGEAATPAPNPAPVHQRPRTLAEAQARHPLVGEQMKQPGGVRRQNLVASFDTKASPFGDYDGAMIFAIQSRWYGLIDNAGVSMNETGRAVISFRLHHDGHVTNLEIKDHTVNEIMAHLCWKAIHDPAPYEKWPDEMRLLNGKDYRDLTFTFFYN